MIPLDSLHPDADYYVVFRENGSTKVARVVFMGMAPSQYDCDIVIVCRVDTMREYEIDDPNVLYRTREEAERFAVEVAFKSNAVSWRSSWGSTWGK